MKLHEGLQVNQSSLKKTQTKNKNKTKQNYNCSGSRHLKVKEQHISLTKNYCIIVSIKIISSVHIFILKIQQILESRESVPHPDVSWA